MDLAKNLKIDSVGRLNLSPALTVTPDQSVREAVSRMQAAKQGCLLVCEGNRLVGIFTERDLVRRVLNEQRGLETPLRSCMTPSPVTVQAKESVGAALRRMQEGGYRHLPVVDAHDQPVGILSVKKIIRFLVEHFPSMVYNQPPNPGAVLSSPDGA